MLESTIQMKEGMQTHFDPGSLSGILEADGFRLPSVHTRGRPEAVTAIAKWAGPDVCALWLRLAILAVSWLLGSISRDNGAALASESAQSDRAKWSLRSRG